MTAQRRRVGAHKTNDISARKEYEKSENNGRVNARANDNDDEGQDEMDIFCEILSISSNGWRGDSKRTGREGAVETLLRKKIKQGRTSVQPTDSPVGQLDDSFSC